MQTDRKRCFGFLVGTLKWSRAPRDGLRRAKLASAHAIGYNSSADSATQALVPPKPKLFDSTFFTVELRAVLGT